MRALAFLISILFLFGCQTEEPKEDGVDDIDYSHFQKDDFSDGDSLKFEGKLGDIDVIVDLRLVLISTGWKLNGELIHKSVGVPIPLSGFMSEDGVAHLKEFAFGNLIATWKGDIFIDNFSGSWMSDTTSQKGHSLSFNLKKTNDILKDYEEEFKGIHGIYDFYASHHIENYPSIIVLPNEENPNNFNLKIRTLESILEFEFGEMLFENVQLKNNILSVKHQDGSNHIKFNLLFLNNKIEIQRFWEIYREGRVDKFKNKDTFYKCMNVDTKFPNELGKRYFPW